MSEQGYGQEDAKHGIVSNESLNFKPWLERWWAMLVISFGILLSLFLLAIANETFGR